MVFDAFSRRVPRSIRVRHYIEFCPEKLNTKASLRVLKLRLGKNVFRKLFI
jgi:hypothetical protein